jgi:hypothetical protein
MRAIGVRTLRHEWEQPIRRLKEPYRMWALLRVAPENPLPDELPDRLVWNYLAKLGLIFAFVVTVAAISLLAYAYAAFFYLANS